jgi:glucosyl-3-phosphoglycerate synthase
MPDHLPDAGARAWFPRHTYTDQSEDATKLAVMKREADLRLSVCLPARNEAPTVGSICTVIKDRLMGPEGLVDELIVMDSGSSDQTAEIAAAAGATVIPPSHALDQVAPGAFGKGAALWSSLASTTTELIVWLDADTRNIGEHFVTRLVAPLLRHPELKLVKAFYDRPLIAGDAFSAAGGGRVTELVVRPMLNLFYPALAGVIQPLAGECALRRDALMQLPFVSGYGVEVALLIDLVEKWGLDALGQADLGVRIHRNRDLQQLGVMSFEIFRTMMDRFEDLGLLKIADPLEVPLAQFWDRELQVQAPSPSVELPPLAEVLANGTGEGPRFRAPRPRVR